MPRKKKELSPDQMVYMNQGTWFEPRPGFLIEWDILRAGEKVVDLQCRPHTLLGPSDWTRRRLRWEDLVSRFLYPNKVKWQPWMQPGKQDPPYSSWAELVRWAEDNKIQ